MLVKNVVFSLVAVGLREVGRHHDAADGGDQGAGGEEDQEEPVEDLGNLPPLLSQYLLPLLRLEPLLHQ